LVGVLVLPPDVPGCEGCVGCEGCEDEVDEPLEPVAGTVDLVVARTTIGSAGNASRSVLVGAIRPTAMRAGAAACRSMPAAGACGLG